MTWAKDIIAVDWGTTNRRFYRINAEGKCEASFEDGLGILAVPPGGFPAAVAEIRARLGDHPMLLAGMVGSNRGWIDVPYIPCPARIDDLSAHLSWAESGRTAIVPGLSLHGDGEADVMRGEEVQLFGAGIAGLIERDALVCHPGTHNKWVAVEGGGIAEFRTVMTGEMFNLLRGGGILSDLLQADVVDGDAFGAGVRRSLAGGILTADLFSARARVLLGELAQGDAASYISGLLIGADLALGRTLPRLGETVIMGRPELTSLYASAARHAGMSVREVDGAEAFVAGANFIARSIR